ncbi:hypothetical protein AGIG_G18333 [Arapaima gigas]
MRVQQRASPRPRVEKKEEEKKEKKKKKKEEEEEEEWGVDLQFCLRQSAEVTRASPAEGDEGSARSGSSGRHIDAAVEDFFSSFLECLVQEEQSYPSLWTWTLGLHQQELWPDLPPPPCSHVL